MIIRVSEARVRPGESDRFLALLHQLVADFPARYDGLLGHDVLVDLDAPDHVVYVSRWRDEAALVAYAGPGWRDTPVTFPDEDSLLSAPLSLHHFTVSAG